MYKVITAALTVLTLVMGLTSCSNSRSGKLTTVMAKVQKMHFNEFTGHYELMAGPVEVREVNALFEPDEIVKLGSFTYQILSIERPEDNYIANHLKDYQLLIHMDTVWVYDEDRLVGRAIDSTSAINAIILKDNE